MVLSATIYSSKRYQIWNLKIGVSFLPYMVAKSTIFGSKKYHIQYLKILLQIWYNFLPYMVEKSTISKETTILMEGSKSLSTKKGTIYYQFWYFLLPCSFQTTSYGTKRGAIFATFYGTFIYHIWYIRNMVLRHFVHSNKYQIWYKKGSYFCNFIWY